jgi:hypothetical protein
MPSGTTSDKHHHGAEHSMTQEEIKKVLTDERKFNEHDRKDAYERILNF